MLLEIGDAGAAIALQCGRQLLQHLNREAPRVTNASFVVGYVDFIATAGFFALMPSVMFNRTTIPSRIYTTKCAIQARHLEPPADHEPAESLGS